MNVLKLEQLMTASDVFVLIFSFPMLSIDILLLFKFKLGMFKLLLVMLFRLSPAIWINPDV